MDPGKKIDNYAFLVMSKNCIHYTFFFLCIISHFPVVNGNAEQSLLVNYFPNIHAKAPTTCGMHPCKSLSMENAATQLVVVHFSIVRLLKSYLI